MNMTLERSGRLRVTLDKDELERFDLNFYELDYDLPKTRQLLNALLLKATRTTDFKLTPGRLFIEAYPDDNGGCIIYFTVKAEATRSRVFRRKKEDSYIFEFSDWDDMLDGAGAAFGAAGGRDMPSHLFCLDGKMRLELCEENPSVLAALNEYADRKLCSRSHRMYTHEHGRCICENNAISRIGGAFFKNGIQKNNAQ